MACLPIGYALFEICFTQLKLFLSMQAMRKQQALTLEIFESLDDPTLVIQEGPAPEEVTGNQIGSENDVLYTNQAFRAIFNEETKLDFNSEVFRLSQSDSNKSLSLRKKDKVFSIRDLLTEAPKFVQENLFILERPRSTDKAGEDQKERLINNNKRIE